MQKKTTKDTHRTRKPHFLQLEKQNTKSFRLFSRKNLVGPEKELSARKTTFSQAEIGYESAKVPFDQLKVSRKGTGPKMPHQSMMKY